MSETDIDQEFRKTVDTFISLANEHIENSEKETVSMALLYAAARFNSFVVASHCTSAEHLQADRPKAMEFFAKQYQNMLGENLDDYANTFADQGKYGFLERGEKET